jgi:hypothetical protein
MKAQNEDYNALLFYTFGHPDREYFIHQHGVDAYKAQTADEDTKLIGLVFALIGLYLFMEKGYSGKEVQRAHMKMAEHKKAWPRRPLPAERGDITITDVLNAAPGRDRDSMIKDWCDSVWNAYTDWHPTITALAESELQVPKISIP